MGKNITELPELPEYTETTIHVVDDGVLSYKATATQIRDYVLGDIPSRVEHLEAHAFITGMIQEWLFSSVPSGWLALNGQTIGSAASGADYANADAEALFTLFWNDYDNTALPILDSSGSPTTRGASAAEDFAANKRLPIFNAEGLVARGTGTQAIDGNNKVGPAIGEKQADQIQYHGHEIGIDISDQTGAQSSGAGKISGSNIGRRTVNNGNGTMTTAVFNPVTLVKPIDSTSYTLLEETPEALRVGQETRAASFGVRWIIKL